MVLSLSDSWHILLVMNGSQSTAVLLKSQVFSCFGYCFRTAGRLFQVICCSSYRSEGKMPCWRAQVCKQAVCKYPTFLYNQPQRNHHLMLPPHCNPCSGSWCGQFPPPLMAEAVVWALIRWCQGFIATDEIGFEDSSRTSYSHCISSVQIQLSVCCPYLRKWLTALLKTQWLKVCELCPFQFVVLLKQLRAGESLNNIGMFLKLLEEQSEFPAAVWVLERLVLGEVGGCPCVKEGIAWSTLMYAAFGVSFLCRGPLLLFSI